MPTTRNQTMERSGDPSSDPTVALQEQIQGLMLRNVNLQEELDALKAARATTSVVAASRVDAPTQTSVEPLPTAFSTLKVDTSIASTSGSLSSTLPAVSFIPSFAGKSQENVNTFLQNVKDTGRVCAWPDEFLLNVTRMKLVGDARSYVESVESLRNATNFSTLETGLAERYSDKRSPSYYRDKLSTLRQKHGEEFEAFADRIRAVSCKTYIMSSDPVRNDVLLEEAELRSIDTFIRGIDPKIGGEIKISSPRTLHEAVRLAMLREEASRFVTMPSRETERKHVLATTVNCSRCRKTGHIADDCRAPSCSYCERIGHTGQHCYKKAKAQRKKGKAAPPKKSKTENWQGAGESASPGPN